MNIFRSDACEKRYQEYLTTGTANEVCALCIKKTIERFAYWRVVKNDFPYDRIAQEHNMLIPLRHTTEEDLTKEEQEELLVIKREYVHPNYDYILESAYKNKTIPKHHHLHLVVLHDSTVFSTCEEHIQ